MSWDSISLTDIEPAVKGFIVIVWTCPRCGHRQTTTAEVIDLLGGGLEIICVNTQICGVNQCYYYLSLDVAGSYKGLNDLPLQEINHEKFS